MTVVPAAAVEARPIERETSHNVPAAIGKKGVRPSIAQISACEPKCDVSASLTIPTNHGPSPVPKRLSTSSRIAAAALR